MWAAGAQETPFTTPFEVSAKRGRLWIRPSWAAADSAAEEELFIKGANWGGFESRLSCPEQVDLYRYDDYINFLANNKFNAVRFPLSDATVFGGVHDGIRWHGGAPRRAEVMPSTSPRALSRTLDTTFSEPMLPTGMLRDGGGLSGSASARCAAAARCSSFAASASLSFARLFAAASAVVRLCSFFRRCSLAARCSAEAAASLAASSLVTELNTGSLAVEPQPPIVSNEKFSEPFRQLFDAFGNLRVLQISRGVPIQVASSMLYDLVLSSSREQPVCASRRVG